MLKKLPRAVALMSIVFACFACDDGQAKKEECSVNDYTAVCEGNVALSCVDGKINKNDCGNLSCQGGECVNPNVDACIAADYPKCDESTNEVLSCVNSKIERTSCGTQSCVSGECVDSNVDACIAADYPKCDETTNEVLSCVDSKIKRTPCGTQSCVSGECVDPNACNDTFLATCEANNVSVKCVSGTIVRKSCESFACVDGNCVDPNYCDDTFVPTCVNKLGTRCQNNVITKQQCTDTETCYKGVCETKICEQSFTPICVENNTLKKCGTNNEYIYQKCGNAICITDACVEVCDPDNFENFCKDQSTIVTDCDSSGQFVTEGCGAGNKCVVDKCVQKGSEEIEIGEACTTIFETHCRGNQIIICNDSKKVAVKDTCASAEVCGKVNDVVACYEKCTEKGKVDKSCFTAGSTFAQSYTCNDIGNGVLAYTEDYTNTCNEDCKDGECVDYPPGKLGTACVSTDPNLCENNMVISCDNNVYVIEKKCDTAPDTVCIAEGNTAECYEPCKQGDPDRKVCMDNSNMLVTLSCTLSGTSYVYKTSKYESCSKGCSDGACL